MKIKKNILITDYYVTYKRFFNKLFDNDEFNFYTFREDDNKEFKKTKLVKGNDIEKICKDKKIDLILTIECSINNYIYKPFSGVGKKLNIPCVSLFPGIIDHPYARRDRNIFSKLFFGIKQLLMGEFRNYSRLHIKNLGLFNYLKYMTYTLSSRKNRYLEDDLINFIHGDVLFEMYPFLRQHKDRFKINGMLQMDGLTELNTKAKVQKIITIIGQPFLDDKLFTEEEFDDFKESIRHFSKVNSDYKVEYRPHPRDPKENYDSLNDVKNFKVVTKDDATLEAQVERSKYLIAFISSSISTVLWFKKKLIIYNYLEKAKNSIYNRKTFYVAKDISKLKVDKVENYYKKFDYIKEFERFFKSISFIDNNTTALQRLTNGMKELIDKNGRN